MDPGDLSLKQLCGQLIVGGFAGADLPASFAAALAAGERGGAILFRRNCESLVQVSRLCAAIAASAPDALPPWIGVDQEGGRVSRLPPPFLTLPAMARLGRLGDDELTRHAGELVGGELRALGFSVDFAPVLDVDTRADNPVIGDRSFGADPDLVARHGVAFARGLQAAGVAACGKHFPGHGDTTLDSHLELPTVDGDRARLEAVELRPFRHACQAGIAALMSAHVRFPALDAERPATLSHEVSTGLLRRQLGFDGVLFSDDLEMGAITGRGGIAQAAVRAIAAGCDALLICSDADEQERAHRALVEAAADSRFADRCREAFTRAMAVRGRFPPHRVGVAVGAGDVSHERWLAERIGTSEAKALVDRLRSESTPVSEGRKE